MRLAALFALAVSLFAQQPKPESEDGGPPVLKRGGSSGQRKAPPPGPDLSKVKVEVPPADAEPSTLPPRPAYEAPAPTDSRRSADPLIERAREAAATYDESLPNFICNQQTLRSQSGGARGSFRVRDRVELELMYVDRREEYRNIRVNGKAITKGSPEDSGSWSTGEFGSTLMDLMHYATDAKFTRRGADVIAGISTIVYDFQVKQPNSHWEIRFGPPIKPAYKGSVWVDPQSTRVLRIEMQAQNLPATHQLDAIEMTVEYGWVNIGSDKHLLPVESQNLACFRGSAACSKNEITFRNYRKFGAESTISTTDSTVSFDGEDKPAPPKKKQ